MKASLDQRIAEALKKIQDPETRSDFDIRAYGAAFHGSAQDKARTVIELIGQDKFPFEGKKPVLVSVGGADGEELECLLLQTAAELGILVEFKRELAACARARNSYLEAKRKKIEVFEGAAQEMLDMAISCAYEHVRKGSADYLLVTCHAVIHELFDRGAGFRPTKFFGQIFADDKIPVWFSYREPGRPESWPAEVLISADCSNDNLLRLAQTLRTRHANLRELSPAPYILGDKLALSSTLAVEVITKLFYIDDLQHEIDERSTSVDHGKLINALMLALGDDAQKSKRCFIETTSNPSESFKRLWTELGISVAGMNQDDFSRFDLPVIESHKRVVAWRRPRSQSDMDESRYRNDATSSPHVLRVSYSALAQGDYQLLESCLANSGRYWIESPLADEAHELFVRVQQLANKDSISCILARFLDALPDLFKNTTRTSEFSEEAESIAEKRHLGLLLRAERMEHARKTGNLEQAVAFANLVIPDVEDKARSVPDSALQRYQLATAMFLVGNLLRQGGRYRDALVFIQRATGIYVSGIPSHDTELAHCQYASLVCRAMYNEVDVKGDAENEVRQHQFASALINLSLAHAAWLLDDVDRALEFAKAAANTFKTIHFEDYAGRAELTGTLFQIWQNTDGSGELDLSRLSPSVSALLRVLTGSGGDWSQVREEVKRQRPGRLLGLLQFARQNGAVLDHKVIIELPPLIDVTNRRLTLRPGLRARNLREVDQILRKEIGIQIGQRLPLFP